MIFVMIFWFMLPAFIFVLIFLAIQKTDHPMAKKINNTIDKALEWRKRYGRPLPEMAFILCMALGIYLAAKMVHAPAVWNEGEIHIFWNEVAEQKYQTAVNQYFRNRIRTPQSEPEYFIKTHPIHQTDPDYQNKFILFILSKRDSLNLPEQLTSHFSRRKPGHAFEMLKNVWVRNQIVYVAHLADLKTELERNAMLERLFNRMKQNINTEIYQGLFKHRDVKKRQKRMLNAFGWTLQTLADFEIRIDDSNHGFVSLSPKTGNRWINVRWIDDADSLWLNPDWVVQERNRLGQAYFHGTLIEKVHLTYQPLTFLNCPALEVRGLWGNEERSIGGPFKSICFYDAVMKRIYLLDYAVHASGMQKMPYLRRLEIVAQSFRTHRSLFNASH